MGTLENFQLSLIKCEKTAINFSYKHAKRTSIALSSVCVGCTVNVYDETVPPSADAEVSCILHISDVRSCGTIDILLICRFGRDYTAYHRNGHHQLAYCQDSTALGLSEC